MELRLLLGVLRAASALVLSLALSGAVAGVYIAQSKTVQPEARAVLLLDPDGGKPTGSPAFVGDPDRYVEGELSIMRSRSIATAAAKQLGDVSATEVADAVTVEQQAGASVVQVTAQASSTRVAARIANAVAAAYIDARHDANRSRRQAQLKAVDSDIASVLRQIQQVQSRVGAATAPTTDSVTRDALLRRYDELVTTRAGLAVPSEQNDLTSVIERATPVPTGTTSKLILFGLLGFLLGGGLGAAIAVAWTLLVPRVLDSRQAEYLVGVPAVAEVSLPRTETNNLELIPPATIRAMHRVAASVSSERIDRSPRTVAVCSTSATGTSSMVAASLARAYAEERFRVVYLSIPDAERLAEHLGDVEIDLAPAPVTVGGGEGAPLGRSRFRGDLDPRLEHWSIEERMPFMSVAQPRSQWAYPIDGERLEMLRRGLEPHADVMVIELPPLLESAVSASAAHQADDLVLVVPVPQQSESELDLARQIVLEGLTSRLHLLITRRSRSRRGG